MIQGFATLEGTGNFEARFGQVSQAGFFRVFRGLQLASIGLGTYLGEMDDNTDEASFRALEALVAGGVNVIDSAINYRGQRSERTIGRALKDLIGNEKLKREEIFISTKGGFLPFDGEFPSNPHAFFETEYVRPGILKPGDLVQGCHAMTPNYLENQIERSLKNLGVESIDLYYVHNPETQLEELDEDLFYDRLKRAFELLERKVAEGKIKTYGTATWNGYRISSESQGFLSFESVLKAAQEAGGVHHHFRAIQLPYNLAMPEAFFYQNQSWKGEVLSTIECARRAGVLVFVSASLLQGQLAHNLSDQIRSQFQGISSDALRALQFVRSTPGVSCALAGMKTPAHVKENLALALTALIPEGSFSKLFGARRD